MQVPHVIEKLLNDVAENEGFSNYKFELESGSKPGEGYQGEIISVKLIGDRMKDGVAKKETLDLMCKVAPESRERRDVLRTIQAFEREVYTYTHVLPSFVKFQHEKGLSVDESFLAIPKVYAGVADDVTETYAVIMEDLRSRDFVMWPRHTPVPLDHEEVVFKQLGRFHGISFAMEDQRPEMFAEFKNLNDILAHEVETSYIGIIMGETIDRAINVLENDEHRNVIKCLKKNYLETWKSFFKEDDVEKFGAVGHGDCWINNIMFQYTENTKEVKDISILDWQFSRYASPVLDVLYHIVSSTRKSLRDRSYGDLLNIYYNSLSDTIRKLGSDPEKLFSLTDFQSELKACGKFALLMGMLTLPFVFAHEGEVSDLVECTTCYLKGEMISIFTSDICENHAYIKAMNEMVGDIISYGYDH